MIHSPHLSSILGIALVAGLLTACSHMVKPSPAHASPTTPPHTNSSSYPARADVQAFIARVAQQDQLDPTWIKDVLDKARHRNEVIAAINQPYEAKPWYQYRPIFVTDARITAGVQFWDAHAATLTRAEQTYQVPASIIVAIIGIESNYGRQHGGYRVLDALATLGFDYPKRGTFFQKELAQFLLMCHERNLVPTVPMGSYAGAMGAPQFMPDSYRQYAVDFDADGKRDIWNNWDDIIGSVANYFHAHGWQQDGLIAVPAAWSRATPPPGTLTDSTVAALRKLGVFLSAGVSNDQEAMLIALQQPQTIEYWVGLHNFSVILSYNKSALYAMAATELAARITTARNTKTHDAIP